MNTRAFFRRAGIAALALLLFLATDAQAALRRIDASAFSTICIPLSTPTSGNTAVIPDCWALPVLEDGWIVGQDCSVLGASGHYERETYLFADEPGTITFVTKMKLSPRTDQSQTTVQVAEDIFMIPCLPKCPDNPAGEDFPLNAAPRVMLLDDVVFPAVTLSAEEGPREFLCAVSVPSDLITDYFLSPSTAAIDLDWFAIADLDVNGNFYGQPPALDLDGNTFPDVAVEIAVLGFVIPRKGIDEIGAGLINFFLNRSIHGLTLLDVFEPQTRSFFPPTSGDHPTLSGCPTVLPGMQQGESRNTRPWCFRIERLQGATLDGGQVVPPTGSLAMGTAAMTIDTTTNTLFYNIAFTGLGSPELTAAIHGPALPGANGPLAFSLPLGNPKIGTWIYPEAMESNLLGGLMYINIASDSFPAGEIRGQIK